jgi:hypothetical protein
MTRSRTATLRRGIERIERALRRAQAKPAPVQADRATRMSPAVVMVGEKGEVEVVRQTPLAPPRRSGRRCPLLPPA